MPAHIEEQVILDSLHQVPAERWDEVLQFLDQLKNEQPPIRTAADLIQSEVAGLWADRTDLGDGREFARRLRQQAESRQGTADAAGH